MGCIKSQPKQAVSPTKLPQSSLILKSSNLVRENSAAFNSVYKLGNGIGSGAYADVRRCEHRISGTVRAVKIYDRAHIKAAGEEAKLLHELEILRELDHPHIVRLYETFKEPELYYFVMEYCRGGELFSLIQSETRLTEDKASLIMHQILAVVSYIHEKGVIHRDLKPENIFLEHKSGELAIKIGDFGLAEKTNSQGCLSGAVGTSYYMAPEIFDSEYSMSVDMWSCGVILYIMLTGKVPFPGRTDEEIIERIKLLEFSLNIPEFETVSPEAKQLITQLMCPAKVRLTAKDALKHAWFKVAMTALPSSETMDAVINNLRCYRKGLRIRDALTTFIATQLTTSREVMNLQEVFRAIDIDADGRISKQELASQLGKELDALSREEEAENIITEVANDSYITYTEFLKAGLSTRTLLSTRNVQMAFEMIDENHSGKISASKLKTVLSQGQDSGDSIWEELIAEADQNQDGQIDVEEFKKAMLAKV